RLDSSTRHFTDSDRASINRTNNAALGGDSTGRNLLGGDRFVLNARTRHEKPSSENGRGVEIDEVAWHRIDGDFKSEGSRIDQGAVRREEYVLSGVPYRSVC